MNVRDMLSAPVWALLDSPIIVGDCITVLASFPAESIDAVCCDPPYGIGFMGHEWDQPGEFGPVRPQEGPHGAGVDAALERQARRQQRRATQRAEPTSRRNTQGPGGKREGARRVRASQPEASGFGAPGKRFGGPTGADNTTHSLRGGAMHAGRYDLSPSANRLFQEWCEAWARECLRVLKPGGYLLASGGTRTYHRLAAGVEDAGFEVRDTLAWLFGSGFPKSLDVSKAIDKLDAAAERDERAKRSQAWLREHVTAQQVNAATGTDMGHHLTTHPTQPFVPTLGMLDQLRPLLPEVPAWLEVLVAERAVESENMKAREVVGEREAHTAPGFAGDRHRSGEPVTVQTTRAHSEEAREWEGWGTALKPAFEPVVVARKPLIGTVARNVLAYGTGALNIDASRIGDRGRWPTNVALDDVAAAILDAQSGDTQSSVPRLNRRGATSGTSIGGQGRYGTAEPQEAVTGYGDAGGASRFMYCAKADTAERNAGLAVPSLFTPEDAPAENLHPTVKPVDLMRWLVRMVTPPGGIVLDPFTGSGTTGVAAALEGFEFVGTERDPEYAAIARARVAHWGSGS